MLFILYKIILIWYFHFCFIFDIWKNIYNISYSQFLFLSFSLVRFIDLWINKIFDKKFIQNFIKDISLLVMPNHLPTLNLKVFETFHIVRDTYSLQMLKFILNIIKQYYLKEQCRSSIYWAKEKYITRKNTSTLFLVWKSIWSFSYKKYFPQKRISDFLSFQTKLSTTITSRSKSIFAAKY